MTNSHWVVDLHSTYPAQEWASILSALFEDDRVFSWVNAKPQLQRFLLSGSKSTDLPDLAQLAWMELHENLSLKILTQLPLQPLPAFLENRAKTSFVEYFDIDTALKLDLRRAALLALSFRERFRIEASWEAIKQNIERMKEDLPIILGCLLGMVPAPAKLFADLFSFEARSFTPDWVLKAYLLNPVTPKKRIAFYEQVINHLDPSKKYLLLKQVAKDNPLAGRRLLSSSGLGFNINHLPADNHTLQKLSENIAKIEFNLTTSNKGAISGNIHRALDLNKKLQGEMENLLGRIFSQIPGEDTFSQSPGVDIPPSAIEAFQASVRSNPFNPVYLSNLVSTLIDQNLIEEAKGWLEAFQGDESHPMINFQWARIFQVQSFTDKAYHSARLAVMRLDTLYDDDLLRMAKDLANFFIKLNLIGEAENVLQSVLHSFPLDPHLLAILSRVYNIQNSNKKALENSAAAYAVSLIKGQDNPGLSAQVVDNKDPETPSLINSDLNLQFIESVETTCDWQNAYRLRTSRLADLPDPDVGELNAFAITAIETQNSDKAIESALNAIKLEPCCAESFELVGRGYAQKGSHNKAIENLKTALKLDPHRPIAWLSLSEAYKATNQEDKILETLRSAVQTLPESFECHLALGNYCLEHNAPTQAIPPLQKAAELSKSLSQTKSSPGINLTVNHPLLAFKLGTALRKVGRIKDGHRILEEGYQSSEGGPQENPDLCYSYAQSLLDIGDVQAAIPLLECLIQIRPDDIHPYLDLAQTLVDLSQQPEAADQAVPLLKKALSMINDPLLLSQTQILLADALFLVNDFEGAQSHYQSAMNSSLAKSLSWQGRITFGLGKTRLRLGSPEAAVAAFHEAKRVNPGNPQIYRWLAEAYLAAGLIHDSFETALHLVQLEPPDPETSIWFADQSIKLHNLSTNHQIKALPDAVRILLSSIQKDPDIPELWFKLAQIHLIEGEIQAARAALEQLEDSPAVTPEQQIAKVANLLAAADLLEDFERREKAIELLHQAYHLSLMANEKIPPLQGQKMLAAPNEILLLLAEIYYRSGDIASAIDILRKVTLSEPENADSFIRLGELLYEFDLPYEALSCLEKALEVSPNRDAVFPKIIWLELETGNLHGALGHLDLAIRFAHESKHKSLENKYRYQAAEIARGLLLFTKSRDYLSGINLIPGDSVSLSAALLRLEMGSGNMPSHDKDLKFAKTHGAGQPRLLALEVHTDPGLVNEKVLDEFARFIERVSRVVEKPGTDALSRLQNIGILRSISETALMLKNGH